MPTVSLTIEKEVVANTMRAATSIAAEPRRARRAFLMRSYTSISLVSLSAIGAAAADRSHGAGARSATVKTATFKMTLDCINMTADARQYATAHNLCTGGASPDNVTPPGDCGTSQIFVYNAYNDDAQFNWGFDSSQGAVAGYGLTISYQINGGGASFGDSDIGPWSSSYRNSQTRFTGAGYLTTQLTGSVALWCGGTCSVGGASDWDWITG